MNMSLHKNNSDESLQTVSVRLLELSVRDVPRPSYPGPHPAKRRAVGEENDRAWAAAASVRDSRRELMAFATGECCYRHLYRICHSASRDRYPVELWVPPRRPPFGQRYALDLNRRILCSVVQSEALSRLESDKQVSVRYNGPREAEIIKNLCAFSTILDGHYTARAARPPPCPCGGGGSHGCLCPPDCRCNCPEMCMRTAHLTQCHCPECQWPEGTAAEIDGDIAHCVRIEDDYYDLWYYLSPTGKFISTPCLCQLRERSYDMQHAGRINKRSMFRQHWDLPPDQLRIGGDACYGPTPLPPWTYTTRSRD